jgi:hypothetical protein
MTTRVGFWPVLTGHNCPNDRWQPVGFGLVAGCSTSARRPTGWGSSCAQMGLKTGLDWTWNLYIHPPPIPTNNNPRSNAPKTMSLLKLATQHDHNCEKISTVIPPWTNTAEKFKGQLTILNTTCPKDKRGETAKRHTISKSTCKWPDGTNDIHRWLQNKRRNRS